MNRDEADRRLAALGEVRDRVAAAMYAIDSHQALGLMRAGGLAGRTATVAAAVTTEVDSLWAGFALLGDALEQGRTIRADRRPSDAEWATLAALLRDAVVAETAGMPALAPGAGRERLLDYATRLSGRCDTAMAAITDTDAAWNAAGRAIAPVTAAMSALADLARDVGDTRDVAALEARSGALRDEVLGDPLTAAPGGVLAGAVAVRVDAVAADIATAATGLRAQRALRDGFADRTAALRARVADLAAAEERVSAAYRRAVEKIAGANLPPQPTAARVLGARIDDLGKVHARREWRRLAEDATALDTAIGRAIARADDLSAAADGLVARRDELRGRLEAYRAKAAGHRLDEHDALAPLHTAARDLLYTAPCDLPAATKAVFAYQRALTELVDHDGKDAAR